MYSSEKIDKITPAFLEAQGKIESIIKNKKVKGAKFEFAYADLAAVINTVKPALNAAKIALMQSIDLVDDKPDAKHCAILDTRLIHESGQYFGSLSPIFCNTPTNPQAFGSSVSYQKRYSFLALIGEPTEDDDGKKGGKGPKKVPQPTGPEQKVLDLICEKLNSYAPHGKCVDMKKIIAITLEMSGKFASKAASADKAAQWFIDANRPEIYIDIPKDEFDEFAEDYHKEHDVPDGPDGPPEPDGPEDNIYQCQKCGLEFPTPREAAECIC